VVNLTSLDLKFKALTAKDMTFRFNLNFGCLGCFDAANPIIAIQGIDFQTLSSFY